MATPAPAPIRFEEALATAAGRKILRTTLSSAQLRAVEAEIRRGGVLSARTMDARYLTAIKRTVERLLAGEINHAKARQILQDTLDQLGYTPEAHFGTPGERSIPPAERGSLTDLSSETRVDLVIQTQVRMMTGAGFRLAGQEPTRLYNWPCWELVRISPRAVPRGFAERKAGLVPVPGDSWPERWTAAGGTLVEGRMVARKDDEVWSRLGDSTLFDDGLDNPYPPFAFNSGYSVREVGRTEAERLGVLDPQARVAEMPVDLRRHFEVEAKSIDPAILKELEKEADIVLAEESRGPSTLERALARRRAAYGVHKAANAASLRNRLGALVGALRNSADWREEDHPAAVHPKKEAQP